MNKLSDSNYVVVCKDVLPDIYKQVLYAKELIASGEAGNVSDATRKAGISRSAFYKYRNYVYDYSAMGPDNIINLKIKLRDSKGALSAVTNEIYKAGANVMSINQSVPNASFADVLLTLHTSDMEYPVESLVDELKKLSVVKHIELE